MRSTAPSAITASGSVPIRYKANFREEDPLFTQRMKEFICIRDYLLFLALRGVRPPPRTRVMVVGPLLESGASGRRRQSSARGNFDVQPISSRLSSKPRGSSSRLGPRHFAPLPVADFGHVIPMLGNVLVVFDQLVADRLLDIGRRIPELRHPVDDVIHQVKAVHLVPNRHIEGGCG